MITFWLAAALMLIAGYLFFVPALAGRLRRHRLSRARLNLALHQQRQEELAREAASPEALARLTAESERNLLGDLEAAPAISARPPGSGRASLVAALVILPVAAALAYLLLGRPDLVAQPPAQAMADARKAIDGLAQRLKENPNDLDGWVLLGRSLQQTGEPERAATAFEFALKLAPGNPELMSFLAESLAEANQGRMAGRPEAIVREILQADPVHKTGLWLAGIAAAEAGDLATARRHWQMLKDQFPVGSPEAREVTNLIAKLDPATPPANAAADTATPSPATPAAGGKRLRVKVDLADEFQRQANPEDAVFIFARAAEGPPMPLAVVRKQVKDLPLEVELTDAMAMLPGMNLSSFERLVIGARISKSGRPVPTPGDLEGLTEPVAPTGTASYSVTISHVVPKASQ